MNFKHLLLLFLVIPIALGSAQAACLKTYGCTDGGPGGPLVGEPAYISTDDCPDPGSDCSGVPCYDDDFGIWVDVFGFFQDSHAVDFSHF